MLFGTPKPIHHPIFRGRRSQTVIPTTKLISPASSISPSPNTVFTCAARTEHHELWISEALHTFNSGALKPGSLVHYIKFSITILRHSPSPVIYTMKKTLYVLPLFHFCLLKSSITALHVAQKRLVLQVYLGSNTLEFSAIHR